MLLCLVGCIVLCVIDVFGGFSIVIGVVFVEGLVMLLFDVCMWVVFKWLNDLLLMIDDDGMLCIVGKFVGILIEIVWIIVDVIVVVIGFGINVCGVEVVVV